MENTTPEWLNEEFLSRCLRGKNSVEEKFEVLKFSSVPVVAEGNNFGSNIVRVNLIFKHNNQGRTQSLSLIVKSPLQGGLAAGILESLKDVESKFYRQFLPIAKQLGNDFFAPKCYFSPNPSVIVMEDLKEEGYIMLDRSSLLDFKHCRLFAISSATFHAVSIAAHKVNPELVESLGEEKLFSESLKTTECYKTCMFQGLDCTSDFMMKTKFKKYAKLVQDAKSYLYQKVIDCHKPSKALNCLNQGDPWIPNMMFKYDDSGNVSDIKLLDFQALRYGSPLNDLVFFLWTSANHDVREKYLEDFFHIYCDTLNNKLKELNCTEYLSYKDLLEADSVLNPMKLFIVVAFVPMQISHNAIDIDDLLSKETDTNGQPTNKIAKYFDQNFLDNFLLRYLAQLEHIGIFEYLEKCN